MYVYSFCWCYFWEIFFFTFIFWVLAGLIEEVVWGSSPIGCRYDKFSLQIAWTPFAWGSSAEKKIMKIFSRTIMQNTSIFFIHSEKWWEKKSFRYRRIWNSGWLLQYSLHRMFLNLKFENIFSEVVMINEVFTGPDALKGSCFCGKARTPRESNSEPAASADFIIQSFATITPSLKLWFMQ